MSSRPKRERKAPERLTYSLPEAEAPMSDESEGEAEAPRPAKRQRRAGKEPAAVESDSEVEEEGSEDEEQQRRQAGGSAAAAAAAAAGPSKRRAGSRAAKPAVPPPPPQPLNRADLLATLHACPALVDCLVEPDGLRTVTLLARDVASLATALCAPAADMGAAWAALAAAHQDGFDGTTEQALEVVKGAVAADSACLQRITKTAAKADYRLSDKDLEGLRFVQRSNPIFLSSAPTKLYSVLDCAAIAHRKFGSLEVLQAAKEAGRQRGQKIKASRAGRKEERKEEARAALVAAGLERRMYSREVQAWIKKGGGTAQDLAAGMVKEAEEALKRAKRQDQMRARLVKEGLAGDARHFAAVAYADGSSKRSLSEVVALIKKEKQEEQAHVARQAALLAALEKAGVDKSEHYTTLEGSIREWRWYVPAVSAWLTRGEGSAKAAAKAVQKHLAEEAAASKERQEQGQLRQERLGQLVGALQVDALPNRLRYSGDPAINAFLSGEGELQAAVAAAQEVQAKEAAREEAKAERRARAEAALAAEGLAGAGQHTSEFYSFVDRGAGSEAGVVAAARRYQERLAGAEAALQRRAAVRALLQAQGLPTYYASLLSAIEYYIETGEGSEAACLAEAKRRHEKDVAKHGGLAAGVQAAMEAAVGAGAAAELPQGG